jgi:hypothetical protein
MTTTMMGTNNYIAELWQQLEDEKTVGLVKRLYSSEINFLIYATFKYPESYFGIAFNFSNNIKIDISNFENLRDLKVLLLEDTSYDNTKLLIIELLHPSNRDIFATLCENLVLSVIQLNTEQKVIRTVINQLNKWKTLFDKSTSEGLSNEQQQGLYGELVFLHKCLMQQDANPFNILNSWVGVDSALRDFHCSTWAVEVKTTATNNPQKVTINGERQLDETLLDNLFLFHCSVEVFNGSGETLNQKIEKIRSLLECNIVALNVFNSKLFEVGYFDSHANKYENRCYKIRSENYYRITDDFPRIKENELRSGVSGVRYDIILAMCDEYLITENQLLNTIQNL